MTISTEQVKALRDETGISVMQCKKALEEADGDIEKARIILAKKSKASAEKKQDRDLGAGVVASYIHAGDSVGVLVELLCETDFVARNEEFKKLGYEIAMHIAAMNPEFKTTDEITDEDKKKAQEVFAEEVADKPEELRQQILDGKMESFFETRVLMSQPYIKDGSKTIQALTDEAVQKFGERVEVGRFARFAI